MRLARTLGMFVVVIFALMFLDSGALFAQTEPPPPPAPIDTTLDALLAKADANGSVQVIVGLRTKTPFIPEGNIAGASGATAQREAITEAQGGLLKTLAADKTALIARYKHLPYIALSLDRAGLEHLIASGQVTTIMENVPVMAALTAETSLIHADSMWAAGNDGDGWIVAILDTGIDENHPFFGSRIIQAEQACYSNAGGTGGGVSLCNNGSNTQIGSNAANAMTAQCLVSGVTMCDHGTHVAGIAAGNAAGVSGSQGNGVAPHARILPIQIFTRFNSGVDCSPVNPCKGTYASDYMAAMDYVFSIRNSFPGYKFAAVNLSIGGLDQFGSFCDTNPVKAAVDTLLSANPQIPTVIAAGNNGFLNGTAAPGCISSAITVGATDTSDAIASFSNRSATMLDLFAPGVGVYSSIPNDTWAVQSGTSMSTPLVTGSFAALREGNPSSTVSTLLTAMKNTGMPILVSGTPVSRIDLQAAANNLAGTNSPPRTPRTPSPSNTQSGVSISNPSLTWVGGDPDAGDAASYTVYLGTSNPPVAVKCNTSSLSCAAGTLTAGTTYYWKVVATDTHSATTDGPVWAFSTAGGGPGPTNDNIANPLLITGNSYNNSQTTSSATNEITDPDLTPCAVTLAGQVSTHYDTVWYRFTPSVSGKLNADTIDSVPDTILSVWSGSPVALTLVACNDDSFGTTSLVSNVSLTGGVAYYIEVANFYENDSDTMRLHTSFSVANAVPNPPSNPSPADNATGVLLIPTLTWTGGDPDVGDTVRYDVYIGTTNPPTTKICSNISAATCTPAGPLVSDTLYRWQVVASDNHAGTVTGPVWSFTPHNDPPNEPLSPSPANNALDVSKTPTLTWVGGDPNVSDTVTYKVYLDTSSNPTTLVCNNVATAACNPAALNGGTLYRWKVVATDNFGTSTSGQVWSFTTVDTPPNVPSAPSPVDGAPEASLNPTLAWTGGDPDTGDAVTYKVYFDTVNPPVTLLAGCNAISVTTCALPSTLTDSVTYYWKVVATDHLNVSTDGPVWSFTALNHAPAAPTTPSPVDGAPAVSLAQVLGWAGSDPDQGDTLTYDVYLDTAASPATLVCDDAATPTCTPAGGLTDQTLYYWKVVATDNHGASTTGPVWSFTAVNQPPATPFAPSPADNATDVLASTALGWSGSDPDAGDTLTYDVYIDTNANPSTLACDDVAAATCTPAALNSLTVYHWKVVATDNHGASTTGPVWTFTTRNNPPNVPSAPSPAIAAISVGVTPPLSWTGGDPDGGDTVTYTVYIDTKSSPTAVACSGVSSPACALPGSLAFSTRYYWKVVALDSHGASATGPVWSFTTAAGPPALSSPKNGAAVSTVLPKFSWKAVKGATEYHLQIDTLSTFDSQTGVPLFETAPDPVKATYTLTPSDPALGYGSFYWRVRAKIGGVWTAYSLPFAFDLTLGKAPARGALIATHSVKFTWAAVKNATGYDLQVFESDSTCVTSAVFEVANVAKPAYTMLPTDPILDFGEYTWRVRASQGVTTAYGPCTPFTITSLKAPKNGSVSATLLPKFSWSANKLATGYVLSASQPGVGPLFDTATLLTPSYTSQPGNFPDFGYYLWHVTEQGSAFGSTPDFGLYITTMAKPLNNAFSLDNTPTFSWKKVTGATSYTLEIALPTDPAFAAPVRSYNAGALLKFTVPTPDGLAQGTYLWRIVSNNGHTMPAWSIIIGP